MAYRRVDLSSQARIRIALEGYQVKGYYGAITDLARQYAVSRWFVYYLINLLTALLIELTQPSQPGPKPKTHALLVDKNRLDRAVVTLWVAGCSLEGIQMCLEEILDTPRSIGSISQTIQKAQEKAATFNRELSYGFEGTGLLDELFCHQRPILTAVEPSSTAILNLSLEESRDGTTWGVRLLEVEEQGFHFQKIASDGAEGILSGVREALGETIPHQLDIGHLFGETSKVEAVLERKAYQAIASEEERWQVLDSARSDRVLTKRIEAYEAAEEAWGKAIGLYEDFSYLASELYALFEPVTPQGHVRSPQTLRGDLEALLDLLSLLPSPKVEKLKKRLQTQEDGLLVFLEEWIRTYAQLQEQVGDQEALSALLLEAMLYHGKFSKASQREAQAALARLRQKVGEHLGRGEEVCRKAVFKAVQDLIRGSSLVETANSWLSPHLLKRRGVSQGFLELFRLAHNTRPYRRGKRKGYSPFELLGVSIPHEDWLMLVGFQSK